MRNIMLNEQYCISINDKIFIKYNILYILKYCALILINYFVWISVCVPNSQSYGFSSSHVWMWELDHNDFWAPKNWCFQIVMLEKTLESPLDCKEIKAINLKGNRPWVFIGRTDAEAEAPILWPPDVKRPWCWERLKAKEEGSRGWDGWIGSLTQWTWFWANSRRWGRTGKPSVLRSTDHRVRYDFATE